MYVPPMNPNSIHIPMVSIGCCKSAYETNYPAKLQGIIQPNEFKQSIENINSTFKKTRRILLIILIVFLVCLLIGIVLIIVGVVTAANPYKSSLFIFIGIGVGVIFLAIVCTMFAPMCVLLRQGSRLGAAIAAESVKYANRSPTPCTWRLDNTLVTGYMQNGRPIHRQRFMIDVGRQPDASGASSANPYNPYSQPYGAPPQYGVPPTRLPYSAAPRPSFCGNCGAPRVNTRMKFCESCGQVFS